MFVHYRTQGFILKKEDRGEADQLFTIYTKDFGKLDVLGKAIRKISSKLRSGAEVFYLTEIEFIQGKAFKTLTDAILINKFENLRKNLKALSVAHKISELLDKLVRGQEPDENLWELLNEVFKKLNDWVLVLKKQQDIWKLEIIYHYFLWNFFSILGYQQEFYRCAVCQKKILPVMNFFNPKEGGLVCKQCKKTINAEKEINSDTVKIIRILIKDDWQTLKKLKIEEENLKSLKIISNCYLSHILGETQ